jgi:hypothetical protein
MARTLQINLIDDIDGSTADETVRFALDGTNYEIDLSAKHAAKLRTDLEKYVEAARRTGTGGVTRAGRGRTSQPARTDRDQNRAIRSWAKRKRIPLSDRGRIPQRILDRYAAEAGR